MKEAIVSPTEAEEELPFLTVARAMNSGWMFRIPETWERKGNGYIFDSDFITPTAHVEVETYLGHGVPNSKTFKI